MCVSLCVSVCLRVRACVRVMVSVCVYEIDIRGEQRGFVQHPVREESTWSSTGHL